MPRKKKREVRTDYALRDLKTGRYWTAAGTPLGEFAEACLMRRRPIASDWPEMEVVDVRCRPLSTRTKAAKKRTR